MVAVLRGLTILHLSSSDHRLNLIQIFLKNEKMDIKKCCSGMKLLKPSVVVLMLLGLPLAGVWMAGYNVTTYLEFPPQALYIKHASFSWPVFIGVAIVIIVTLLLFIVQIGRARSPSAPRTVRRTVPTRAFPWWGWLAVGLMGHTWILAWTRQPWFGVFQPYTFTPLWVAYIVVINALTWRRSGRCLLTHETVFFLKLFPLSAAFWWFFEYLNRFVQNWWYILGTEFSPLQYFIAATLPFSTVLPAVLSTEEWLATHPRSTAGLDCFIPIRFSQSTSVAWITLAFSGAGLFFIGWFPDQLFPLLWVAPLILLLAFRALGNHPSFFPEVEKGDWRRIYRVGLAALICGFFWEMWNLNSLAKWIYTVPYVGRFHLFEMPILGYAGYLPFGLECAVIAEIFLKRQK
jgi:hypothetical protein